MVPASRLTEADIKNAHRRFTYRFYTEAACKKCDNLPERHNDICDECPSYLGAKRTSKMVTRGESGKTYLSMPVGASRKVKKWLVARGYADNYKVKDRTPEAADFSRRIRVTKKLYDYQVEAVETMLEKKRGIIDSPPRSGKTVLSSAAICKIGKKTLILGAQRQWLLQFRETFVGSETQEGFTNCKKRQIGICKKIEDFRKYDICLATFSIFMSTKGKKLMEKIREWFGCVVCDEIQGVPALQTSRVLSRLNARYMFGLSGTVERKVTEEIQVAHDLIGPIIHKCIVPRLRPKVVTFNTGMKIKDPKLGGSQAGWTYFQTRIENDSERRKKIVKEVIKYAKRGHLVFIPLTRVNAILSWVRDINYEVEQTGYAMPYFGGMKRPVLDEIVQKARRFEIRVLVGQMTMLSTGLNIPRASCLFQLTPTANIPKCDQRVSRILTPMPDKPQPILVQVLDDSDLIRKCMQKEWWGCIKPRFDPIMLPEEEKALLSYFAASSDKHKMRYNQNLRDGLE